MFNVTCLRSLQILRKTQNKCWSDTVTAELCVNFTFFILYLGLILGGIHLKQINEDK